MDRYNTHGFTRINGLQGQIKFYATVILSFLLLSENFPS